MKKDELKERVDEMLSRGISTLDYYFKQHPELQTERESLHQSILQTILGRKTHSKGKRIFMVGGAPTNGKSAFIRNGPVRYPENILKVDPDEIKLLLPEYLHLLKMQEPRAALTVHEESSLLAKNLRKAAIEEGHDLLLDVVANHSAEARMEDVRTLKTNGHWVRMDYVTLDTPLSLQIASTRFNRTGRMITDDLIREYNRNLATLVPQLIDNHVFDELYLWDTNIAVQPRLILRQRDHEIKMINPTLYEDFKRKAYD